MRLAHGWEATAGKPFGPVREDLREAVRAVPPAMAERLGRCRVELVSGLEEGAASEWTETAGGIEIRVAAQGITGHDAALELLLCLGQALWERLEDEEWKAWWKLLDREIRLGTGGEIDEDSLAAKRALLAGRDAARNRRTLQRYARAAFAGTAAGPETLRDTA